VSATNVTIVPAALSTFAALTFVTLLSVRGPRVAAARLPSSCTLDGAELG